MIKKLLNYLSSFKFCKKHTINQIPLEIANEEKIVRSIFSPINLSKDGQKINTNSFRPPAGLDEISVNRLDYTSTNFCKQISKKNERPESDRSYFGFGLLYANEIRDADVDIVYSPLEDNKFHSDIKIGFTVVKGEPLPAEINFKIKKLASSAKLFADPSPDSRTWDGSVVE